MSKGHSTGIGLQCDIKVRLFYGVQDALQIRFKAKRRDHHSIGYSG
ncbi:hypothetical protein ACEQPO_26685 [Bacillus sp. SL00103]